MQIIADLHVHSKYARATSKNLGLEELARWAKIKGVNLVATGDFTYPKYFSEIETKLEPDGQGFFSLRDDPTGVKFILSTEVACIYKHHDTTRRLHLVLISPDTESVKQLIELLTKRGFNLKSDGRPILGIGAKELLAIWLGINPRNVMIPAHIWTPWFALFGSKSGYDRIEDCFGDLSPEIFALETGLSSDPEMNWSLSALDRYALVSNSDAHSGPNIGREANVFDLPEITYDALMVALKQKDPKSFLYTIEFFPEEGMYHYDGHRSCQVSFSPAETKKKKNICPVCKKQLTVGVLHRVDNLRDREFGSRSKNAIPFKKIIPLPQIIADYYSCGKQSKKVQLLYQRCIDLLGNEFYILLEASLDRLLQDLPPLLAEGIIRVREQKVELTAGYDGVYGTVKIFKKSEKNLAKQAKLFV